MPLIVVRKRPGKIAANIIAIANGTSNRSDVIAHVPNSLGIIRCGDVIFGDHHRFAVAITDSLDFLVESVGIDTPPTL